MCHNQNIWKIKKFNLETLMILEITDSVLNKIDTRELFLAVLRRFPKKGKFISVSQFFSPSQSKGVEYDQMLIELNKTLPSQFATTANFDSLKTFERTGGNYVIHAFDTELNDAILNILQFSGATLSNIIYSFSEDGDKWLQKITNWNKSFVEFFWLKSKSYNFINLVSQVDSLLWTSDGHINLVIKDDSDLEQYLIILQEIAKENSLILKVSI